MAKHLLVTNDFPPKVGGIQNYLWELWSRMPEGTAAIYCTPHAGAVAFDALQNLPIERSPEPFLLPYPWLARRIRRLASEFDADLVLLDPALPLGQVGPSLGIPYGVILHGAEVTVPAHLPGSRQILRRVLRHASLVISAGDYALAEAEECARTTLPSIVIPPGVDTQRFVPLGKKQRSLARAKFGLAEEALVIAAVSRLVPRKGMDRLIRAGANLAKEFPNLEILIGGAGRESGHLRHLITKTGAPVRLLGRLDDGDIPLLYGAADMMAMLCHDRWGGLEQEGFGIVFLEAAACGIPQVAGRSGGAAEAVVHGQTGLVVAEPTNQHEIDRALRQLLRDPYRRLVMGQAARSRAVEQFDYSILADRLHRSISIARREQ